MCYDSQYSFLANYKVYQGLLVMAQEQRDEQTELDIDQDLERTFVELEFFQRAETRQALKRLLTAFANYDQSVGYV